MNDIAASKGGKIEVSDLLPGDVLLHRSLKQKLHQEAISRITGSPYTHASIYYGDGRIADSTPTGFGVDVRSIDRALSPTGYVGVLRSQYGFGGDRPERLRNFINELLERGTSYDYRGIASFERRHADYFANQLDILREKVDNDLAADKPNVSAYFCSALIVASFCTVGIIGDGAQAAYPPNVFSPGDLHRDPTFGWRLGYLVPDDVVVPEEDPLRGLMSWDDCLERWWA